MKKGPRSGTALNNHHPRNHAGFCYFFAGLLLLSNNLAYGGYRDDVGNVQLVDELGANTPYGSGVKVTVVEVDDDDNGYAMDPSYFEFAGKTITNLAPIDNGFSGHAQEVGSYFFGNTRGLAPGIIDIEVLDTAYAGGENGIRLSDPRQPAITTSRISNSSYSSDAGDAAVNSEVLRRVDWLTERDEYLQFVAAHNVANGPDLPLHTGAYNVVTVGRTDGGHYTGTLEVDDVYNANRTKPDLVAPPGRQQLGNTAGRRGSGRTG